MLFEGLEGCVREQKRFQQIIKHESKIYQNGIHQTMKQEQIFQLKNQAN